MKIVQKFHVIPVNLAQDNARTLTLTIFQENIQYSLEKYCLKFRYCVGTMNAFLQKTDLILLILELSGKYRNIMPDRIKAIFSKWS